MATLNIEDIIKATEGKVLQKEAHSFTGISIDSRSIKEGELFIALKGTRFDGHDFIKEALSKGSGEIISTNLEKLINGKTIIYVHDTLKALQNIAHSICIKKDLPVIGITGSNGKTTTKELIFSILSTKYKVLKNKGNLNNHISLPLSLVNLEEDDEIAVLEMGASRPGDIKELCEISSPIYGVLTNIGKAHLEGFKDLETVRKTKLELLEFVDVVVVNADDSFLLKGVRESGFKGKLVTYGMKVSCEVSAKDIRVLKNGSIFTLLIGEEAIEINPKISGFFNIYNILAAASIGHIFDIDLQGIKSAVESFAGVPMRFESREINGIKFICDLYNANPTSMECALRELVRVANGRKIAVLGDMLELGSYTENAHRELGKLLSELLIDVFVAVGPSMSLAASEFKKTVYRVTNADEAAKVLKEICKEGDTVLIKGSRGMNMERILGHYAL